MKKGSRDVANAHRATQEQQKVEHEKAWKDPYDEKSATHNNKWWMNMLFELYSFTQLI